MRGRALVLVAMLPLLFGCEDGPVSPERELIDPAVEAAAAAITSARVRASTNVLADDAMAGRGTPTTGLESAAAFLAARLTEAGVEPAGTDGFMARFDFPFTTRNPVGLFVGLASGGGPALEHGRDYALIGSHVPEAVAEVLWAGSAVATPQAGGLDLTGRTVLYDLPVTRFDEAAVELIFAAEQTTSLAGAAARGFVVPEAFTESEIERMVGRTERWSRSMPTFWIRESAAESLLLAGGEELASLRAGGPQVTSVTLRAAGGLLHHTGTPPNVVGRLRGSDPALRDEYVVVSAHYDHLGVGLASSSGDTIYNGADDNASGTAAVLEVARALASLERAPARSVLLVFFSGEEHGLRGSRAFVAAPTVPMGAVVANINLDMVGRNDPGTVLAPGARFSSLGAVADSLATRLTGLGLAVVASREFDWAIGASDQFAFICRQVPAMLIHTGLHDQYHRPDDEVDRLDVDKIARVARLTLHLVHRVADTEQRPNWTVAGDSLLTDVAGCS